MATREAEARDEGAESISVGGVDVPLLGPIELEIVSLWGRMGRDGAGRTLIAEQEAMFLRLRRNRTRFEESELLIIWNALDLEFSVKHGEDMKKLRDESKSRSKGKR